MTSVLVVGAGRIGTAIAHLLSLCSDYTITIADSSPESLLRVDGARIERACVDVRDRRRLAQLLERTDIVLSACPYELTELVALAAVEHHVHYLDLTEDMRSTRAIQKLAARSNRVLMPQCGLAPGFIAVAANAVVRRLENVHTLCARVGALPLNPSNALKYNLTWSTSGLVNEYCSPCEVVDNGERREVPALDGHEEFCLDGVTYEAFYTSGGLGTLCQTLAGKVQNLSYKTIRYPGHRSLISFLGRDLRLRERKDLFESILEYGVPHTAEDVVVIYVTATGEREGRFVQETFSRKIYPATVGGQKLSAIQLTTASAACVMLDLLARGELPDRGFVTQESVALHAFLDNRFGRYYGSLPSTHFDEFAATSMQAQSLV